MNIFSQANPIPRRRRAGCGLKIRRSQGRRGSSPLSGTSNTNGLEHFALDRFYFARNLGKYWGSFRRQSCSKKFF